MRWRERGAWWRTLLGLIIAIVVLLVVHVSLLVAGPPPVAHGAWMVLTAILLLVAFGGWFAVAVLPATLMSMEERVQALERRTLGQDSWLLLSSRCGLRLTGYRAARVLIDESGLTLTLTSGAPIRHPWLAFTGVAIEQRRVLNAWRPAIVLRGPRLSIVAIPWVLGFWPAAGEVTRQAGALQARIAAAQRSAPPSG